LESLHFPAHMLEDCPAVQNYLYSCSNNQRATLASIPGLSSDRSSTTNDCTDHPDGEVIYFDTDATTCSLIVPIPQQETNK
jgi:hypothetical protein